MYSKQMHIELVLPNPFTGESRFTRTTDRFHVGT